VVRQSGGAPRGDPRFPGQVALGAPALDDHGSPARLRGSDGFGRSGVLGGAGGRLRGAGAAPGRSFDARGGNCRGGSGPRRRGTPSGRRPAGRLRTPPTRRALVKRLLPDLVFDPDRVRSYRYSAPRQTILFLCLRG
jgi:hypothetical protein